jgi:iron complex outermembrane receptor protein
MDVSLRWQAPRASGEITYFRNNISDYIIGERLTPDQFAAGLSTLATRFPGRDDVLDRADEILFNEDSLPILEFTASDSLLQGIEAHSDISLTSRVTAELGLDYVRAFQRDDGEPLPRIPPLRGRIGLRYQYNAFQTGGDVTLVARQDRVAESETPTDGYQLARLFAVYSFGSGANDRVVNTFTFRIDNLTNELYRSHLSLIKDFVPQMGRNVKLLYSVKF